MPAPSLAHPLSAPGATPGPPVASADVSRINKLVGRVRGDDVAALRAEVAELRELVLKMNHTLVELNHDVRSGAERGLPLFLGYAERLRLDADTAIAATQVIERQLAIVDRDAPPPTVAAPEHGDAGPATLDEPA